MNEANKQQKLIVTANEPKSRRIGSSESVGFADSDEHQGLHSSRDTSPNPENKLVVGNVLLAKQTPPTRKPVPPDIAGSDAFTEHDERLSCPEKLVGNHESSKATDNVRSSTVQNAPNSGRTPMGQYAYRGRPDLSLAIYQAPKNPTVDAAQTPLPYPLGAQIGLGGRLNPLDLKTWRRTNDAPMLTTPTEQLPHSVRRFIPGLDDIHEIPYKRQWGEKRQMPEDLASGDIMTMCARLQKLGFHKEDESRWFLVLGKLKLGTRFVILPIATFNSQGTEALGRKAGYAKPIERKTKDTPKVDERLCPQQAVFSVDYLCRTGSMVLLANAFIVEPDRSGILRAEFQGYLTKESFEDVLDCVQHLITCHQEAQYLFGQDINDWDLEEVKRKASLCSERCRLSV